MPLVKVAVLPMVQHLQFNLVTKMLPQRVGHVIVVNKERLNRLREFFRGDVSGRGQDSTRPYKRCAEITEGLLGVVVGVKFGSHVSHV